MNIGAAARAMRNFGFGRLRLVNPYQVAYQEAKSAVHAHDILERAVEEMEAIVSAERFRRDGIPPERAAEAERVARIAESCLQANSQAKIRPVLRAFGVPEE